jgi:hypothetical protein
MKNVNNAAMRVLLIAVLISSIYTLQNAIETHKRGYLLFKMTYAQKQNYIEKQFKYEPVYEYCQLINEMIPDKYLYSLYAPRSNYMYYYSRLNYFLYPKYIVAKVSDVSKINEGKLEASKIRDYAGVVFALHLFPTDLYLNKNGLYSIELPNGTYYALVHKNNCYILTNGSLIKQIRSDPVAWKTLIKEFSLLYPSLDLNNIEVNS